VEPGAPRGEGNHVEHWLNGVKVVEYEFGSPDWNAKLKASKFAGHPHFGATPPLHRSPGPRDRVSFRNIKIRVLRECPRQAVGNDVPAVLRLGRLVYLDRRVYANHGMEN